MKAIVTLTSEKTYVELVYEIDKDGQMYFHRLTIPSLMFDKDSLELLSNLLKVASMFIKANNAENVRRPRFQPIMLE